MIIKQKPKVYCDLCCDEIKDHPFVEILSGKRVTIREGVFCKAKHADICDNCINKLRDAVSRRKEGAKNG